MADIFISYAKKNKSRVEPLAKALETQGWSVWWDPIIPTGKDFDEVIEEEISKARCVIVIWTKRSVKSKYVKGEAREALERGILVPIQIESGVKPPYDFRSIQTLSLIEWDGSDNFPGFQKLIADVISILGEPPTKVKLPEPISDDTSIPEPKSPEPRKKNNALKFGAVAGVIVLLIVGIWWWSPRQQVNEVRQQVKEVRQEIAKLTDQALNLGNAVAKVDNPEQFKEFTRQRNTLSHQVEGLSEQAIKIGMQSQLEQLQNRLERIQIELANKGKELIAARKGPISPQKTITNSIGMKFVLIPAGNFTMGSQLSPEQVARRFGGEAEFFEDEHPPHPVEITKPFYLQTTEVSQGQWEKVMGNNPSRFKDCGDDCPVEQVSWDDAQEFISKLNQLEGTNKYRLPTEAEWEYACKAKTETAYSFGDESDKLGEYAWFTDNSGGQTHPGGKKKPNAWGLYDMHGNVWEWCQDWYGDYSSNSVADPKGPDKGEKRVLRGGSWINGSWLLRSVSRNRNNPDGRGNFDGFRVAQDL